jgi:DNA-binding beta-propeller fold protein YncE
MFDKTGAVKLIKNGVDAHFGLIDGLAMDDNDRLFVSDLKLNRVLVFDPQHKMEAAIGGDVLSSPGGLAIDTENRLLYVVDTGNDVVRVYDADSLKPLRVIGTPGKKHTLTEPGTFSLPTNVAVDGDGNVYVTDTFNNRVEIFDADGEFIGQFGKAGDGAGQFERPKGIAVDGDGHIWVVDAAQDRVKVFDREGRLLIYFGEHGEYPGRFMGAYGITIDKENRVIVSETFPGRVQIFHYVNDAEAEAVRKAQSEGKSAAKDRSAAR